MSRTDLYKKKHRIARHTLLLYGEGLGEEVFLKHLRYLYSRNTGVGVIIRNGKGGNARSIVIGAVNEPGDFNYRVVVFDNDKGKKEVSQALDEAKKRCLGIIQNSPCLEALLLSILRPNQDFSMRGSGWCKNEFETCYIPKKKRTDKSEYEKLFTKQLLDARRRILPQLDALIVLMEKPNTIV